VLWGSGALWQWCSVAAVAVAVVLCGSKLQWCSVANCSGALWQQTAVVLCGSKLQWCSRAANCSGALWQQAAVVLWGSKLRKLPAPSGLVCFLRHGMRFQRVI